MRRKSPAGPLGAVWAEDRASEGALVPTDLT